MKTVQESNRYDVIIIGAGVSGAAIARELSRYDCRICVLEKEEDVCCQTSKANSGIVHAGHDAKPGSLKAKLNVRGNELMETLAEELDIPFVRNGSLVVCTDEKDREKMEALLHNGQQNKVPGLTIIGREKLREMEPNITESAIAALYAPTGGIVCPFELNIGLAENAFANGTEFQFGAEVTGINRIGGEYEITTIGGEEKEKYIACVVINAAGVYADTIHNMVSDKGIDIIPRKGEYFLLDKAAGKHVTSTIFDVPGPYGKGVLVTPTVHGNLLVGPTAIDIHDKEGTQTTAEGLGLVREQCRRTVEGIPFHQVITSFAGLRANEKDHDFIIEETADGFIDCAGIASPGLSSCPAIGESVAEMVVKKLKLSEKEGFIPTRKGILHPSNLSEAEQNLLIEEHPEYGTIICRCEMITEGEIRESIRRPLGAKSMDGVKRRTRAGMGRCQSGFCAPKVMEILSEELECSVLDITKSGGDSAVLMGQIKETLPEETL